MPFGLLPRICVVYIAGCRRICSRAVLLLAITIARCDPGFRGNAHGQAPSHSLERKKEEEEETRNDHRDSQPEARGAGGIGDKSADCRAD